MGRIMTFTCKDCNYHKDFFTGSGMLDFNYKKQKVVLNCPKCGFLSLRTVKCEYSEETDGYIAVLNKTQTCRKCKTRMIWAGSNSELTCPICLSKSCEYNMSGVWD